MLGEHLQEGAFKIAYMGNLYLQYFMENLLLSSDTDSLLLGYTEDSLDKIVKPEKVKIKIPVTVFLDI